MHEPDLGIRHTLVQPVACPRRQAVIADSRGDRTAAREFAVGAIAEASKGSSVPLRTGWKKGFKCSPGDDPWFA